MCALALACLGITIVPNGAYLAPMLRFAVDDLGRLKVLPFAAGLVTYVPLIPLVGWIGLLTATDPKKISGSGDARPDRDH